MKAPKRILKTLCMTLILIGGVCSNMFSQIPLAVEVTVVEPYPSKYAIWMSGVNNYMISVTNNTNESIDYYIRLSMEGEVIAPDDQFLDFDPAFVHMVEDFVPIEPFTIGPGLTVMLFAEDFAWNYRNMSDSDIITSDNIPLNLDGELPTGEYVLCATAHGYPTSLGADLTYYSPQYCSESFNVNQHNIELDLPSDGDVVNPCYDCDTETHNPVIFNWWVSTSSVSTSDLVYSYNLYEIDTAMIGEESIYDMVTEGTANRIVNEEVIGNVFTYDPHLGYPELIDSFMYAWQIEVTDPMGLHFEFDGKSGINTFWYRFDPNEDNSTDTDEDGDGINDEYAACHDKVYYEEEISTSDINDVASLSTIEVGYHTIHSLENVEQNGNSISGEGVVTMPFLMDMKVAVEFSGIKVNQEGRMYEGFVKARDDSNGDYDADGVSESLQGESQTVDPEVASKVSDIIYNADRISDIVQGTAVGMPIGYSGEVKDKDLTIAITKMRFEPTYAHLDIMSLIDFGHYIDNFIIAVGASSIAMIPDGFGSEYILHPSRAVYYNGPEDFDVKIYGSMSDDQQVKMDSSTYIKVNCDGIESFAVRGEFIFPRTVFVPDEDGDIGTGKVAAVFDMIVNVDPGDEAIREPLIPYDFESKKNTHLMMSINMDTFQITGLEGWSFELVNGWLDLSEQENPPNMKFPENYVVEEHLGDEEYARFWSGLWLEDLNVYPPKTLTDPTETLEGISDFEKTNEFIDRLSFGVQHFIFDHALTIDVDVDNVLDKEIGRLDGWGLSIDTFRLAILQNVFEEGRMTGEINTPLISKDDYLEYAAYIDQDEEGVFSFNAVAKPHAGVKVPMLFASAGLCPNSYLSFSTHPENNSVEAFIKGHMSIDIAKNIVEIEGMDDEEGILPELTIRLAEFQLNMDSEKGMISKDEVEDGTGTSFGFGLDATDGICGDVYEGPFWESAAFQETNYEEDEMEEMEEEAGGVLKSAQETLNGFPISINDLRLAQLGAEEIGFDFDLEVNLGGKEGAFGGSVTFNLLSDMDILDGGLKTFKPNWPTIDSVFVFYEKMPLTFDGSLKLTDNEDGSAGFHGDVLVSMGSGLTSFELNLKAGYNKDGSPDGLNGPNEFGTDDYFAWWYVDGAARFSPGIPVLPPYLVLNGFGGGVYWNCDPLEILDLASIMNQEGSANGILPDLDIEGFPVANFKARTFDSKLSASIVDDNFIMIDSDNWLSWGGEGEDASQVDIEMNADLYLFASSYPKREESAWIWGRSENLVRFEKEQHNKLKVAYLNQSDVYLKILKGLIRGAGEDNKLGSMAMAFAHEDLYEHPSNVDSDNLFWHFLAGDPYDPAVGPNGVKIDLAALFKKKNEDDENMDDQDDDTDDDAKKKVGVNAEAELTTYFMMGQGLPGYLPEPTAYLDQFGGSSTTSEGSFSGGGIEAGEDRDADQASTGKGFINGLNVSAEAEIRAVIYASLSIFAGIDMMVTKEDDRACIIDGVPLEDPGIDGWYGQGRAYAGLTGAIGAKGKLFGKEIDVKVLEIAAGMMLEAGGIEPTWLDGRADLTYNLLAGLVKGNARMNINVGDKCEPPRTSPFDFPIIDETYPYEGMSGIDEVDPYIRPSATFTVPLNETFDVLDVNDETWTLKPYMKEFTITEASGDNSNLPDDVSHDFTYSLLHKNGRTATYDPTQPLARTNGNPKTSRWRMKIVVGAKELKDGKWKPVYLNGKIWEEEENFVFTTSELGPYIEGMGKTVPNENQKFVLQDEIELSQAMLHVGSDLDSSHFYNVNYKGRPCEYFALLKDGQTNETIEERPVSYYSASQKAKYIIPTLQNDKKYYYQIVRRYSDVVYLSNMEANSFREITSVDYANLLDGTDTESSFTINTETEKLNPDMTVGAGEELLYKYAFTTSKYNTLAEKLATLSVSADKKNNHDLLTLSNFEGFDRIDIFGYDSPQGDIYENSVEDVFDSPSRVIIEDYFESPFSDLGRDVLGGFWDMYGDEYSGEWTGCVEETEEVVNNVPQNTDIPDMDGADDNSITLDENETIYVGENTMDVRRNFLVGILGLNYRWDVEEGHVVYNLYEYLNDDVSSGLISNVEAGSEMNFGGSNANVISNIYLNKDVEIKYHVTNKVMEDAQYTVDFATQEELVTSDFDGDGDGWNQTMVNSDWVWNTLFNLRAERDIVLESSLYDGLIDLSLYNASATFNNILRFRANTSYEYGMEVEGSTKDVNFQTMGTDTSIGTVPSSGYQSANE